MNPKKRHNARRLFLQAIYQWQISETSPEALIAQYQSDQYFKKIDQDYFNAHLTQIIKHHADLDEKLSHVLNRTIDDLDPIELAILRIGAYELLHCKDIPPRVLLNEAVELAKAFGAQDSYKFVNTALDQFAKTYRPE